MASLLRRLPSFRRSTSSNSQADSTSPDATADTATTFDVAAFVEDLDADEARQLLVRLSADFPEVRKALQLERRTRPQPIARISSASVSKKRRAETELEKEADETQKVGEAAVVVVAAKSMGAIETLGRTTRARSGSASKTPSKNVEAISKEESDPSRQDTSGYENALKVEGQTGLVIETRDHTARTTSRAPVVDAEVTPKVSED